VNIKKSESSACRHVFRVELGGEEFSAMRAHAFHHVAEHANLPGFRKGKVPQEILEKRFGREVEQDAVDEAVRAAASQILENPELIPVRNPTVSAISRSAESLTFTITVETAPKVELGEYRGLEFDREPAVVRPEDVDAVIEGLRRRLAAHESVSRPARWGDMAVVDYEGTVDGKPIEGGAAKDAMVTIGGGNSLRSLEEALVGRKGGDVFEVSMQYPANYSDKGLAGKTAKFSVSVKEVKEGKLPGLDDEFAKSAGGHAGLAEMRSAVVQRLRVEREKEAKERLRETVVERLLRFAPPEVAPSLVEEEMNLMAVRRLEELRGQGLRSLEDLRLKPADFREMFRGAAVRGVREAFVLDAITRAEKIQVPEEDMEKEVRASAGGSKAEADKLVATLKADGRWERLRHRFAEDRTLDWIIGQSKVTERAVCP